MTWACTTTDGINRAGSWCPAVYQAHSTTHSTPHTHTQKQSCKSCFSHYLLTYCQSKNQLHRAILLSIVKALLAADSGTSAQRPGFRSGHGQDFICTSHTSSCPIIHVHAWVWGLRQQHQYHASCTYATGSLEFSVSISVSEYA
jgi:hypothetical protein